MRRREFISLLAGVAATGPFTARAQQADRFRRVSVLAASADDDAEMKARLAAFRQRLEKRGWAEGRNVQIDVRFAAAEKFESLAKEIVVAQPDVILAHTTPVAAALQRESRTIPIVFVNVSDPIGSGFIQSLSRPGGNFTGVLLYEPGIVGKWLAMLKEIAPSLDAWRFWLIQRQPPMTTSFALPRPLHRRSRSSWCLVRSGQPQRSNEQSIHWRALQTAACSSRRMAPSSCIAILSSRLRRNGNCLRFIRFTFLSRLAASCHTEPTEQTYSGWRHPMLTASCAATNPPTSQCKPRPNSKRASTLERQKRSASPYRRACSSRLTKCSNKQMSAFGPKQT